MTQAPHTVKKGSEVELRIDGLDHDGRGVGRLDGKAVFVTGALPGERVTARLTGRRRRFDEAETVAVLDSTAERVSPGCAHFGVCGGCRLQHLAPAAQIATKEAQVLENLRRLGGVEPMHVLPPLDGPLCGYRRKARLGAKYVHKKGRVLVGFRERGGRFIADLGRCEVLVPQVGEHLTALAQCIGDLSVADRVPQIEVAAGDNATALVLRHLDPLRQTDRERLADFGKVHGLQIHLQPGGPESVTPLWPAAPEPLSYTVTPGPVTLRFAPTDFVQVNGAVNQRLIEEAAALAAPDPEARILDLFCGLGNFSLPLATRAGAVTGVEGDAALVARARDNAALNGLTNAIFHAVDLTEPLETGPFAGPYDTVLLDPPRTGAAGVLPLIPGTGAARLVYVSCNPATLARDAALLAAQGFCLEQVRVADMFPHTHHVEMLAYFIK